MKQRPLLFLFLATALAMPLLIRAQQPAFRSAIDVVSMNVTVTDSTNKYITDLTEQDFEIFEDGVKQDLTLFNRTNLPVALSLLIDTSSSMEDRMATRAGCGHRLRAQAAPERSRRSDRVRQPGGSAAEVHEQRQRARAGDSQDGRGWIDVVEQRDLHLAEGLEENSDHSRKRKSAARPSFCCLTAKIRRAS